MPALRNGPRRPLERRASALERAADLLEQNRALLLALLQVEGGKTLDDAVGEWREAIDYCRYYAAQARITLISAADARSDGRKQRIALSRARRVRLHLAVEFSAGDFPRPGRGGARGRQCGGRKARRTDAADRERGGRGCCTKQACRHPRCISSPATAKSARRWSPTSRVAGVAFTGSTEVGLSINRALAAKDGPIVPLIAETGGINAMIVDATALAGTGDRRCRHLGVPLRRAALLGVAAPVRAGGCRRPPHRDDRRRGAGACRSAIRAIRPPMSAR